MLLIDLDLEDGHAGRRFDIDPPGLAVRLDAGARQFATDLHQKVMTAKLAQPDGVRVLDDGPGTARIAVTVAAYYGAPMSRLVEQVRSAVAVHAPGHPVDVTVADVA